jgi:aquaporin related protein
VTTTLAEGTNLAQGLIIEMFLTALLVFTILMLAAEKHRATFIAPIGIGLALFIGHLAGVRFTGGQFTNTHWRPPSSFGSLLTHD